MAGAGGSAASPPPSPEVYTPSGWAVRVVCDEGHPLTGLFLVWSERAPGKGGDRAAGTPEADILEVADEVEPPPGRFAAGFVDRAGYLQPMFSGVNPWLDIASDRRPHTYKLQPDREYPFILLRHPSAELARGLAAFLNEPKGTFDFDRWGGKACFGGDAAKPESLVKARPLTTTAPKNVKPPESGKELYLVVKEAAKPEDYWPKGHKLYNEWTLYLDMPNGACVRVVEEVERLQKHLGTLRYPVGIQERPYWPERRTDKLKTGNLGIFEMRTAAALVRFQEHAAEARAFKLAPEAMGEVHGKLLQKNPREPAARYAEAETWACLLGREVGPKRAGGDGGAPPEDGILPEIEQADVLAGHAWGVADAATGKALEHWLTSGYRKPGRILLRVKGPPAGFIYLREEAAVQLEAWRQVLLAFGVAYPRCAYGMPSGHSFRDISGIARGVAGVLNNSIHKTGLAIDFWIASTMNDTDFTRPAPDWSIRMEQRFDRPSRDPAALAKRQLETAEKEKKAAADQREKDAKDPRMSGGASTQPAGATPLASVEQARARSTTAKGRADAARKAKSAAVLSRTVAEDDAQLAALDDEIAYLKKEIDRIEAEVAKTKSSYRMRFCLYGHSTLDVFGNGHAQALRKLLGDIEALPRALEDHLAALFPSSVQTPAKAWIRDVAFGSIFDPKLASRLPPTPELVVKQFFRLAIRPFLFDPLEADGGTSWSKALVASDSIRCPKPLMPLRRDESDLSCLPDRGAVHTKLQPFSGQASSYVSLTGLGQLCDMFGIGTAGSGWKRALATLDATTSFPAIAEKIEAASKHEDAKLEDVVIARKKVVVKRVRPEKLDVPFMKDWAAALADLAVVSSAGKKKPSACFRIKGARLVVRLPPPELASDGDRLVPLLNGKLAAGRFVVVDAGKESGLLELPKAGALKGSDLGAKLEAGAKAFKERVEAFRKAAREAEEARKKEKPKGKGKPAEPDLAKRERAWFEVTLQPLFETDVAPAPDLGNVILQPGDVVQIPAPGIPRTLEWWHYQSLVARGDSWENQIQEIGFSTRILKAADPPEQDGGDWDGRGIGYTSPELSSKAGGEVALSPPSNVWDPPPPGW